jgi:hypothetical protein
MRPTVKIFKERFGYWVFTIGTDKMTLLYVRLDKLIDALNMARCLRVHVDNAAELPLQQYPYCEGTGLLLRENTHEDTQD